MTKNAVLAHFENYTQLGPTFAAQLLGVPYSTYAQLRNGTRQIKVSTERHIEALSSLPVSTLHELIKEHVRDGWSKG